MKEKSTICVQIWWAMSRKTLPFELTHFSLSESGKTIISQTRNNFLFKLKFNFRNAAKPLNVYRNRGREKIYKKYMASTRTKLKRRKSFKKKSQSPALEYNMNVKWHKNIFFFLSIWFPCTFVRQWILDAKHQSVRFDCNWIYVTFTQCWRKNWKSKR